MHYRKYLKGWSLVTAGLIASASFVVFNLSNFEASEIKRNSITFQLAAPQYLRPVKLFGECKQAEYLWKGRDGEGVPFGSITFGSAKPVGEILGFYQRDFEEKSCKTMGAWQALGSKEMLSMSCDNQDFLSVKVFVVKEAQCKEVTVDFIGIY